MSLGKTARLAGERRLAGRRTLVLASALSVWVSISEVDVSEADLQPHAYVLAVHDLAGSAAYFVNGLGFSVEWEDGENWRALRRGDVRLMLGRCPDALPPAALGDHGYFGFFATLNVDALYTEFTARGAIILSAPADKPWGWREMAVGSPEGHRMMFAQRV